MADLVAKLKEIEDIVVPILNQLKDDNADVNKLKHLIAYRNLFALDCRMDEIGMRIHNLLRKLYGEK